MDDAEAVEMDAAAVADFLGRRGTGVLALARDGESYAVPVSYGYDEGTGCFYLRLGFGPVSEKRRFVETTERATLVVYGQTDDRWRSVVARGALEPITEADVDLALVRALRQADLPLLAIFDVDREELSFQTYRLDPDELGGRTATADPDDWT